MNTNSITSTLCTIDIDSPINSNKFSAKRFSFSKPQDSPCQSSKYFQDSTSNLNETPIISRRATNESRFSKFTKEPSNLTANDIYSNKTSSNNRSTLLHQINYAKTKSSPFLNTPTTMMRNSSIEIFQDKSTNKSDEISIEKDENFLAKNLLSFLTDLK